MGNHIDLALGGKSHFQRDQIFQHISTGGFRPSPRLCQRRSETAAADSDFPTDLAYPGIVRPCHQRADAATGVIAGERFHRLRVLDGILGKYFYLSDEPWTGRDGAG